MSASSADFDVLVTEPPALGVTVIGEPNPRVGVDIVGTGTPGVVEVRVPGPAGPPGTTAGGGSDAHYVHEQSAPATLWTITHGLGKRPAVAVLDSAGTLVEGDVTHLSASVLTVEFGFPFSGAVYLN